MTTEQQPCMCEKLEPFTADLLNMGAPMHFKIWLLYILLEQKEPHHWGDCGCVLFDFVHCEYRPFAICTECDAIFCLNCFTTSEHASHQYSVMGTSFTPTTDSHNCSLEKKRNAVLAHWLFKVLSLLSIIQAESHEESDRESEASSEECYLLIKNLPLDNRRSINDLLMNKANGFYHKLSLRYPGPQVSSVILSNSKEVMKYKLNPIPAHNSILDEMFYWLLHHPYSQVEADSEHSMNRTLREMLEKVLGNVSFEQIYTSESLEHCEVLTLRLIKGQQISEFDCELLQEHLDKETLIEMNTILQEEGGLWYQVFKCLSIIIKEKGIHLLEKRNKSNPILIYYDRVVRFCSMRTLFRSSKAMEAYFEFLILLQNMNCQIRVLGSHVEYEDETMDRFFEIEHQFTYFALFIKRIGQYSLRTVLIPKVMTAMRQWLDQQQENVDGTSFHLPLHRILAVCLANNVSTDISREETNTMNNVHNLLNQETALQILGHLLQLQVMVSQISCNMWVRNGSAVMGSQLKYYKEIFSEADLHLIRLCALVIDPEVFISTVLNRFQVTQFLGIESSEQEQQLSEEESILMLEEVLSLLSTMFTTKTCYDITPESQSSLKYYAKQYIGSALTMCNKPYSQLVAAILHIKYVFGVDDELVEQCIEEVAEYIPPSVDIRSGSVKDGCYTLTTDSWKNLYNPLRTRMICTRERHSKAVDRYSEHVKKKKLYSDKQLPWLPLRLPTDLGMYQRLAEALHSSTMSDLLYAVLHKYVNEAKPLSDETLCMAVHQLELSISFNPSEPTSAKIWGHILKSRPERSQGTDEHESSSSEDNRTENSMLSLLFKLYTKLSSSRRDVYVPEEHRSSPASDEEMASRIGNGAFFVAKVLDKIGRGNEKCKDLLNKLHEAQKQQNAQNGQAAKKEKARRSREAAMAKMKQLQAKFKTAEFANVTQANEGTNGTIEEEDSNKPLCVICHEEKEDEDLALITNVRKTRIPKLCLPKNVESPTLSCKKTEIIHDKSRSQQEKDIKNALTSLQRIISDPSLTNLCYKECTDYITSCGHNVHKSCFQQYGQNTCPMCQAESCETMSILPDQAEKICYGVNPSDKVHAIANLLRGTQQELHKTMNKLDGGADECHKLKVQLEMNLMYSDGIDSKFQYLYKQPISLIPNLINKFRTDYQVKEAPQSSIILLSTLTDIDFPAKQVTQGQPVLIMDTIVILCKFVLALPSSLPKQLYQHLVSILYFVRLTQTLLLLSLMDTEDSQSASVPEHFIGDIFRNMKHHVKESDIEKKLTIPSVKPSDIISFIQKETSSFLKFGALLQSHLYKESAPSQPQNQCDHYSQLCEFLGMKIEESNNIPILNSRTAHKAQFGTDPESLLETWLSHFIQFVSEQLPEGQELTLRTHNWTLPGLITLPPDMSQVKMLLASGDIECRVCKADEYMCVCLICNEFICDQNECLVQHVGRCNDRAILFLPLHDNPSAIIIFKDGEEIPCGGLYLNKHGESSDKSDAELSNDRYELMRHLWLSEYK